jgi:hypothetical protein
MPRYHFDLWHGTDWTADESGVELPDDAAAAAYGNDVARDIARNRERDARTFCITVRDAARRKLFILPFSHLAEIVGHVDPATRATLEVSFTRQRELSQAIHASRTAVARSRAAVARSRGKPYLVA